MASALAKTLKTLNCTCKDAACLLSEQGERSLSRAERIGLSLHLMLCRACRRYRRSMRFLGETMKLAAKAEPVPASEQHLSTEARERIRGRLGNS
jgi:hypothetical protein